MKPSVPTSGLPPRYYRDPAVLDAEHERILERTWQLAGHVSAVSEPGSYITSQAGSQPVLVVRGKDRRLRAFRSVCRHRHVPIAHPGLMRLLDYRRYEAERHENYVWFDAPLRDRPAGTRAERLYRRLVRPMPGLDAGDVRVWRYVFIYPNTAIDLYPDQVMTWQIRPDGPRATRGYNPGPLSGREAAVGWFADRIRADLAMEWEPTVAA